MKWLSVMLILLCSAFAAQASAILLPLTPEQGLSQGAVRNLHLDRHGFLWVATAGGINRFDGNTITELHARNYRLSEISFNDILEDSQGRLWLSADNTGLYLYNPQDGHFDLFITAPQETAHPITTTLLTLIEYDADHLLFVVNQAIYKLRISDKQLIKLFDLASLGHPNGWIRDLLLHDNQLFIAAFNGLIHLDLAQHHYQYLPHTQTPPAQATAEQLHTKKLYLDDGYLYVGAVAGLYQLRLTDIERYLADGTPYLITTILPGRNIWQLEKKQADLFVATDLGFYRLADAQSTPALLLCFTNTNQALIDNTIVDFVADPQGGFWFANRTDGAFYWHPQTEAFNYFASKQKLNLSSDRVTQLWQHGQHIWLSTVNGLNLYDLQKNDVTSYLTKQDTTTGWSSGNILGFVTQGEQTLWLNTVTGIKAFDIVTKTLIEPRIGNSLATQVFKPGGSAQFFDPTTASVIIKQQKQLFRYYPASGEAIPLSQLNDQLPMNYFHRVLGQLPDNSWLLSTSDQLWRFEPLESKLSMLYKHADYQPQLNRHATTMQLDNTGTLWVGMQGIGLLAFDTATMQLQQHLSVDNKLRSNEVFSLLLDDAGDIWFSSRQGLARLEPESLQLEYFNKADGLAFNEFHDGAALKLTTGQLLFAGMRGVLSVTPEKLMHAKALKVVITDFSVLAGEQLAVHGFLNNRDFHLTHTDAGLKINFSAMSFHNNHKITYRYWLQGRQTTHYPPQQDPQVLFPQLAPGHYQFHVVAISPLSGEQSEAATLYLTISPPFWRSGGAYLFYLLFCSSIALLYWYKRLQQQRLLKQAHQQVQTSEQRLIQALSSVNSGVFEWQALTQVIVSNRLPKMLGRSELMQHLSLEQHCALIHPNDLQEYRKQWQGLLEQPTQLLDVTYRMQHQDGRWLWFRDQGRVTELDENNTPLKILGTYSNITETKAHEEKARLFGEAFQQTRDWVVILDARQRVVAANQSFSQAFGGIESYISQPRSHHLGISLVRRRFYTKLLKEMEKGKYWQGEEIVITPDGLERPTLINISAIGEYDIRFYVLVFTDITAQKAAEEELRYLASYDALTGLPNRALLMDRIQHGIEQAKRQKRSLALCFIDLDKFKHINDSLGHDIGDLMLKEVARRLRLALRDSDTVARLGGDEFVVLLEGYKNNDNISHVARKMLSVISEPMLLGSENVGVSPSIGIAVFPDDALNGKELMKHADVAMYHAKEAGRNNFQFFIKEMNEKAHMQLARETKLRKALHQQEFVNYYQPIIDSATQSIVGAEVLLRWQSCEGMISPAEFIPLAEELRLIVKMTQQLLERALQDILLWRDAGYELYLSVNLSTQHLEQPALAETVLHLLQKYQLPEHCLRFEITESALMRDQVSAIRTMQSLSDSGIKLALDDFGTGYSSLKYLKELPLDAIKIDRSFVQDIGIDHNDEAIIDAMLSMANSLGLYCVAEGVETEQQLAFFNKRGCFLIQGFLFSAPLPAAALLTLLRSDNFAINMI